MNGWFTSFDRKINSVENNLQELTQAIRARMQAQSRASDSSVQVPIEFNVLKEFIENDLSVPSTHFKVQLAIKE